MATITWNIYGGGDWYVAADWTGGRVPGPGDDVGIPSNPEIANIGVVLSTPDPPASIESLTIQGNSGSPVFDAYLHLDPNASLAVGGGLSNYGDLYLETGASITIGGTLANIDLGALPYLLTGIVSILNSDPTGGNTTTHVTAAAINNTGAISVSGGTPSEHNLSLLYVEAPAGFGNVGTLTGSVNLSGDALVEFTSGEIVTIASAAALTLTGPDAFVADSGNLTANSALTGLTTVDGSLTISSSANVAVVGSLTNTGAVNIGSTAALTVAGSNVYYQSAGSTKVSGTLTAGTIDLAGGTLELAGGGSVMGNLVFTGPGATLQLDAGGYSGSIAGFSAGDSIDLAFLSFNSTLKAVWQENSADDGGTLSLVEGSTTLATLNLSGLYISADFTVSKETSNLLGTTLITETNQTAPYDFNGDGYSDILFQNVASGQAYVWLTNGTSGPVGNNIDPTWHVVTGAGDYNGDGRSDILWQNVNSGQVYEYQMNGTSVTASGLIGNNSDPSWQVVSSGDFNGDGYSDILFQNANSGQVYEWLMNGFSVIGGGLVGTNTDPTWQVVGTGDFNGDGKSDILFQNVHSGQVYEWLMNGTSVTAGALVGNNIDPTWHVVGTGDFTGNGIDDVLFQNATTGELYEWQMNGTSVVASGSVGNNSDPSWQVIGTGDYAGNGIDGIVFQNTVTGSVVEWLINGFSVIGGGVVGNNSDPSWHVIAKT
jgi:hypothetical protein